MAQRVVDALEMIEVQEQAGDVRAVAMRQRQDLLQALVEERAIGQPGEDVVLRELVRMRGGDFQLLRPLRYLVFERALVVGYLGLGLAQLLRHVVERVGQQAKFVRRLHRHVDVESSRAHCARRAHQAVHGRHQAACQQQRRQDGKDQQRQAHGDGADHLLLELAPLHFARHADAQVSVRRPRSLRAGIGLGTPCGRRRRGSQRRTRVRYSACHRS